MEDTIFGEVIYAYTDKDAIEDGVVVDISNLHLSFKEKPLNRMTRTLWNKLREFSVAREVQETVGRWTGNPPSEKDLENAERKELRSMLKTKLGLAGFRGGIWQVPPRLWLIENELGGWTIMFPEDY